MKIVVCLILALGGLFILCGPEPAQAFCVYNHTGITIAAIQKKGQSFDRGFDKAIGPDGHACCNWKDHSCNKKKKRDSMLVIQISRNYGSGATLCNGVWVEAGGWISVRHKGDYYWCESYYDK